MRGLCGRKLVAVAIIGQVMPDLAMIPGAQRQLVCKGIFSDKRELMDVSGLHVLRPNRIQRIGNPKRLSEGICNGKRRSPGSSRRSNGIAVDGQGERRTRSQALVEGVTLEETGRAIATADHKLRHCLIGETESRHDLLVVAFV